MLNYRASRLASLRYAGFEARWVDLDFGIGVSFGGCFCACIQPMIRSALGLPAGCEREAFAIRLQDMDMMHEAVEERAGEPFEPKTEVHCW